MDSENQVIIKRKIRLNEPNVNGDIYPRDVMERCIENFNKKCPVHGNINTTDSSFSHKTKKVWIDEDFICTEIEVLDTLSGQILQNEINDNQVYGFGFRGTGSVINNVIQSDFELFSLDIILLEGNK